MMKLKKIVLMTLATMSIATGAFASVPSGYDRWVNVEKVTDWRQSGYSQNLPESKVAVNVPKVTALEARTDGYCHEIVKSLGGDIISMPNQDGPSITEEQLEEMMKGN